MEYRKLEVMRKHMRTKEKRKNHMEIRCMVSEKGNGEVIEKELKKAVHRINHLLEENVSYDLTITLEKPNLKIF